MGARNLGLSLIVAVALLAAACGQEPARDAGRTPVSFLGAGPSTTTPFPDSPTPTTWPVVATTSLTTSTTSTTSAPTTTPAPPSSNSHDDLPPAGALLSTAVHGPLTGSFDYPDARVRSRFTVSPSEDGRPVVVEEISITTRDGVTVWDLEEYRHDFDDPPREVESRRAVAFGDSGWDLLGDGTWWRYGVGGDEGRAMSVPQFFTWDEAQLTMRALDLDAASIHAVGWEQVAGRPAMHLAFEEDPDVPEQEFDVWLDRNGIVVRLAIAYMEDHPSADGPYFMTSEWVVIEYDAPIEGPLPPDLDD